MATILLVEDDALISETLTRLLRARGHEVRVADSIAFAETLLDCEMLLCDLGLPDGDGLELIQRSVARDPSISVIAITAKVEDADVVAGLLSGAVDYVKKPFSLVELLARIDAQLRLRNALKRSDGPAKVTLGDLSIDTDARRVTLCTVDVELRKKEFDLLVRLAASAGRVVLRHELMEGVWGDNWWGSTKTLDVHVNSLRRKLGELPGGTSRIRAIRGVGYRLEVR